MKNIRFTILAALVLAASQVAHAQAPIDPAAPGAAGGQTTAAVDSGAISNAAATTTTDSTSTTITSTPGIDDGTASTATVTADDGTTQLANTGGSPLLVSLMGLSIAASAFLVRRRVSNN